MTAAVVPASYVKLSTLSDGTVRIVLDVEPKDRAAAFALFTEPGVPLAVARLTNTAAVASDQKTSQTSESTTKAKPAVPLASKIAIVCRDVDFHKFMRTDEKAFPRRWQQIAEQYKEEADRDTLTAEFLVKELCVVARKRDIESIPSATEKWRRLYRDFQQWRGSRELAHRVGAAA